MSAVPIKISIGRQNIRTVEAGSAAELGRNLKSAFDDLAGNLGWFTNQLEGFLPQDLADALGPTLVLAKVYVPKDTGDLEASGYVAHQRFRGGARAEIGFGRHGQPDYAIYVHEMPFRHAAPTRDKFLQVAIDEDYYNILQRVTDSVRIRFGG